LIEEGDYLEILTIVQDIESREKTIPGRYLPSSGA
jgi:hypothetical protein